MLITLGLNDYKLTKLSVSEAVYWDTAKVVNPHMLLVGKSGTGKTHTLRRLLHQIMHADYDVRIHIFDVHGDIHTQEMSSVQFSESTDYGINPLEVYPDPDSGGVRKRVRSFISTIGSVRNVGERQEAVMRNLLMDLYRSHGFIPEDSSSWAIGDGIGRHPPKRHPTLCDLHRFAHVKLQQTFMGANSDAARALFELNGRQKRIASFLKKRHGAGALDDAQGEEMEKLKGNAISAFIKYVSNIETGREFDDLLKYDSSEALKSIYDRLENLMAIGIFKDKKPPFDPGRNVWRYDITALSEDEKKLFVEFRLQEIYLESVQRGLSNAEVKDVIVLDEAHLFFRDDSDGMINKISREGRKFGLCLICASQSTLDFSDDFMSCVATKIILGIDQSLWDATMRKMKIERKTLEYIRPKKTMAVNFSLADDLKNAFTSVRIGL